MKLSISAAILLLGSQSHAALEETSLMQGLLERHSKLSVAESSTKAARQDSTAKLMETATKMMKNGATPDVITFIEETITEVQQNVLSSIVDEHHRDQALIYSLLNRLDEAVDAMQQCCDAENNHQQNRDNATELHKQCRSQEALVCASNRHCEFILEELWKVVRREEEEMQRIHWAIHGEWCVGTVPEHPSLADPWHWTNTAYKEGPETFDSVNEYPAIDLEEDVFEFRKFTVDHFGQYIIQKKIVWEAWEAYYKQLEICRGVELVWDAKVDECDDFQDKVHSLACQATHSSRQCKITAAHSYDMSLVAYNNAVTAITQLEYDRKREWETLHITTCLLETVYTHVIHSIDSGEPCPTTESHPNQTEHEINYCHVVPESLTANLTIDYGEPPLLPTCSPPGPEPCTRQYLWAEHGSLPQHIADTFNQGLKDFHASLSAGGHQPFDPNVSLSVHGWPGCAPVSACIPCEAQNLVIDPLYVRSDFCGSEQRHLQSGEMDISTFKCLTGNQCILSSGRCNGESNCDDGSDEVGCGAAWGTPAVLHKEECGEPFLPDVQGRCADNSCYPIEGRCNGVNNCANGEDEEGCTWSISGLQHVASTGYHSSIAVPSVDSKVFWDREYTFDSIGSFAHRSYIKISNDDKRIRLSHVQTKLSLPHPTTVVVVKIANHELPWLESDGWTRADLTGVIYHGVRETRHKEWDPTLLVDDSFDAGEVWQKTYPAGAVELRGNDGGDGSYLVFLVPAQQVQVCCEGEIAQCLACRAHVTVEEFCIENAGQYDCPNLHVIPSQAPVLPPGTDRDCKPCEENHVGCSHPGNADHAWCHNNCALAWQSTEACGTDTSSGTHCFCGTVQLRTLLCRACESSDPGCTHPGAATEEWCYNSCAGGHCPSSHCQCTGNY